MVYRTRILTAELTSVQDQIESLKQQKNILDGKYQTAEDDLMKTTLKYQDFLKFIPTFSRDLKTQRTELKDVKRIIRNWNRDVLASYESLLTAVSGSCKKFSLDKEIVEENLKKVSLQL